MKAMTLILASAASLALAACGGEPEASVEPTEETAMTAEPAAAGTIVEVAQGNPDFSTLVTAVTAAGLGETLSGAGPYTVFAPTDAAFAKLPAGALDDLVKPENKDKLSGILTYHVVAGDTGAAALTQMIESAGADGAKLTTVNGATLTAKIVDGNVMLTDAAGNSATVTATDVDASNGMIHVIDTVLMPS